MISTGWEAPRSSSFSAAGRETVDGYAIAALGGGAPGALGGRRPQDDRRCSEPVDVPRGEPLGSRDQISPWPRRFFGADARLRCRGLLDNIAGEHAVAITNLPPIH